MPDTVWKGREKQYMRVYMRDRRAEEKARAEAEEKQRKLKLIEELLVFQYVSGGPREEYMNTKPKITMVPVQTHHYAGQDLSVKKTEVSTTPEGKLRIRTIKEVVPLVEKEPSTIASAKVTESVSTELKPSVHRVQEAAQKEGVLVNEIYVKRDIESYLSDPMGQLLYLRSFYEFDYHMERFKRSRKGEVAKINGDLSRIQAEQWLKEYKAFQFDFEQFIITLMRGGKTDEEILSEAQFSFQNFSKFTWEDLAKVQISQIREVFNKANYQSTSIDRKQMELLLNVMKRKREVNE